MTTPIDNDQLASLAVSTEAILAGDGFPDEFQALFLNAPAICRELLSYRLMIERQYADWTNVIPFRGDAA